MKKVTPESIVFQPIIKVHDAHRHWAISFDSGSSHDLKRESRTLWLCKEGIQQLDIQVDGFGHLDHPDDDAVPVQSIAGRIRLVAIYAGDTSDSRVLADCALVPWAQHRGFKPGHAVNDVALAVRNGTAAAFSAVVPDLFPPKSVADLHERLTDRVAENLASRAEKTSSLQHGQASHRWHRGKTFLAAGAVAIVLWIVLAMGGRYAQPAQTTPTPTAATPPELQGLVPNQGLGSPPGVDAQAQVEIVKSTLKSMGLDPGASGNTGCLVQPH